MTNEPAVQFRLLGPPEASVGDQRVDLGPEREQRLIVPLLLARSNPVERTALPEWVWDKPSRHADELLYELMTNLRGRLATLGLKNALVNKGGLCRLAVPPESVDVHRFDKLVNSGWRQDDAQAAAELFREAVGLFYGEPLAGLRGWKVDDRRRTLMDKRTRAIISGMEFELLLGRHQQVIPQLAELARGEPLNEQVAYLLMLAHYRASDQDNALSVYHNIRRQLDKELGVGVGKDLGGLYQQILKQDPALDISVPTHRNQRTGVDMTTTGDPHDRSYPSIITGPKIALGVGSIAAERIVNNAPANPAADPESKPNAGPVVTGGKASIGRLSIAAEEIVNYRPPE